MDNTDNVQPFDGIVYRNEYNKKNYDRIVVMAPKGSKDILKQLSSSDGISVNKYILNAIEFYSNHRKGE